MRNKILTYLLLLPLLCLAQGQAENRIVVFSYLDADGSDSICKILYYDELGREEQKVIVGGSPMGKDLVSLTEYDRLGRMCHSWPTTPTTKSTGDFTPIGDFMDYAREYHSDTHPYSTNAYETSPLARIATHYGEGEDWHRKGTAIYTSKVSTLSCKGLLTGSISSVIGFSDCQRLYETFYYDCKGRNTCSYRSNLLGGYTHKSKVYDYVGNMLELCRSNHTSDNADISESFTYTYDRQGRLLTEKHCLNNGLTRGIASYTYDGIGRIASCRRNASAKYATSYKYNIRGWQTEIASSRFKETLSYNTKDANNRNTPCYNGNISAVEWGFRYGTRNDFDSLTYAYEYDGLDRLTSARYYNQAQQGKGDWYSTDYIYDKQGNVIWLSRNNYDVVNDCFGLVDNAHFRYNGNKLLGYQDIGFDNSLQDITLPNNYDGGVQFAYDTSGNVIANTNKGIIKITYNLLNLPERIYFSNGNVVSYVYDTDGEKLRVEHGTVKYNMVIPETGIVVKDIQTSDISGYMLTSVKYYDGAYRFTQNTSNGKRLISEIDNDGFTIKNILDKNPVYCFEFTDHLGCVRVVEATNGTTYGYYNFYPYGGNFDTKPQVAGWQKRYCGKEVDLRNGLDLYDWQARWYAPALPRFYTQDKLAENDYAVSPYCYCHDNPVNSLDYDGNSVWSKVAKIGFRVGKSVTRHGWSALTKTATYADAVADIREDIGTVFDGNASTWERIGSGASLLSEISPVSWHDVKDGYKIVKEATKHIHGNSKLSSKAQYAYDIIDNNSGKIVKTGISGGKIRKDGKSCRAEQQVHKWNKEEGEGKYKSTITKNVPEGEGARDEILKYEKNRANELRRKQQLDINKHIKP